MNAGASIIIPTLNEEKYIPTLLDSLKSVSIPLDIIVVDGASTDRTCEVVQSFQSAFTGDSSLTVLQSPVRGIAFQRNEGAKNAKHEMLIFCDADTAFVSAESFEKLISTCNEKKYVIAGPMLRSLEPGIFRYGLYRFLSIFQKILIFFNKAYFPGACLVTSKEIFNRVGGFNTDLVLGEDIDFSLRAAQHGSFGMVNVPLLVSDRRNMKYGYTWILFEIPNLFRLLTTGKVNPDTMYYPFGAYSGEEPYYVTKRTSL